MWVIRRKSDGKFLAKIFTGSSFTDQLFLAEKFESKLEAESRCGIDEYPVRVDAEDYFKRG